MHATIRRYDGVDQNRTDELTRKVNENLVPKLEKLPGFKGYFLVEDTNGVFTSLGLFETPEQGKESSKFVATWIRDEKLDSIIPNEPKITSGRIVAQSDRVLVSA
jgi:hypothetical protein